MSQSGGPGASGQPPGGPPDWQSAPKAPQPAGWQSAPQPPVAPGAAPSGSWQSAPQAPTPPAAPPPPPASWQSAPQPPQPPAAASWQSAPKPPVAPNVPPPQPPSWTANLTSTVPTPGPSGFVYADVPNRSIAMVIDVIAMFFVYLIVGIIAVAIFGTSGDFVQSASTVSLLVQSVISFLIWFAYFGGLWVKRRGTLGMSVLGMQIGDAVDGRTLTWNQAVTRFLGLFGVIIVVNILVAFVPSLGILGLLSFFWFIYVLYSISSSPTKQGIHDKYAKTMVVKTARRAG